MNTIVTVRSSVFSKIGSFVLATAMILVPFASVSFPLNAFAADGAELSVLINGVPPTGYCIAGPVTVSGAGKTGGQGGKWHLSIGWGNSTTTSDTDPSIITSGAVDNNKSNFTYSATNNTTSGAITVVLYHSQPSGQDGQIIVINQCVAAPTEGVVVLAKHVINDSGTGTATASDFTLSIGGNNVVGNEAGATPGVLLSAGTYTISETGPSGYAASYSCFEPTTETTTTSSSLTVVAGKNYKCTVTNNDVAPTTGTITLNKTVVNDDGGTATQSAFQAKINGNDVPWGVAQTLPAGNYTASEIANVTGYAAGNWGGDCAADGTVSLAVGQNKTCTITNDDIQPKITVTKVVVNDNGGTKQVSDFPLFVGATGVTSGVETSIDAGTYTVSETGAAGYAATITGDCAANGSITLAPGEVKSCTITNNDQAAQLTVIKHVVNDNGGTATAGQWTMNVTATAPALTSFAGSEAPGTIIAVDAGAYNVDETGGVEGYAKSLSADCSGTIANGESKTCTITNDDIGPSLTLVKEVVNLYRGTASAINWTLSALGAAVSPTNLNGTTGVTSGSTFKADTYTLSESGPLGYNASAWACVGGSQNGASIALSLGQTATCTITNSDKQPGTLRVIKHVVNDNPEGFAGTASAGDFTLSVTGGNPAPASFAGNEDGVVVTIDADASFSVAETGGPTSAYGMTLSGTCSGTMPEGGELTCTVTNNDNPATTGGLTVVKVVINDNGGTKVVSDFPLKVSDGETTTDVTSGANNQFAGGVYAVSETADPVHYTSTFSGDCDANGLVTVENGVSKTCTITNDDIQPKITVTKVVVNDNGGTKQVSDFPLFVGATSVTSGVQTGVNAGTYTISETGVTGYAATITGDCAANGSITLAPGDVKSCTITNDDQPASLTVIKHVINNNGGSATASNFTMHVAGTNVSNANFSGSESGTVVTLNAGEYSVTEDQNAGYAGSSSEECSGTIAVGESKTCTITNDDGKATLTIKKETVGGNGTFEFEVSAGETTENVSITTTEGSGTADVALDAGTYTVSEIVPATWNMTGLVCDEAGEEVNNTDTQVSLSSGDHVTCTFTNVSTVADLSVTKSVDDSTPDAGQTITYSIVVSNSGPADAANVIVTDLLPSGVTYISDDSATSSTSYATSTGVWTVGALANGASKTLNITVMVNVETESQTITNTASVVSNNPDTDDEDNSDAVVVTINNTTPQCSDGKDNDSDGLIDMSDSGCSSPSDDDETNTPSSGGGGGGGGANNPTFGGGSVLGASTTTVPQVLGASCAPYLRDYLRVTKTNDPEEVKKLQTFLNEYMKTSLPVTGVFGPMTDKAVRDFQATANDGVLKPWVDLGLLKQGETTGYVYKTTKRWINLLKCPSLNIPLPPLP